MEWFFPMGFLRGVQAEHATTESKYLKTINELHIRKCWQLFGLWIAHSLRSDITASAQKSMGISSCDVPLEGVWGVIRSGYWHAPAQELRTSAGSHWANFALVAARVEPTDPALGSAGVGLDRHEHRDRPAPGA